MDYKNLSYEEFAKALAGQYDETSGNYEGGGYVALMDILGNTGAIYSYSHCSCYGTSESLGGPEWEGTAQELIAMAYSKVDPFMAGRFLDPEDFDYHGWIELYKEVITFAKNFKLGASDVEANPAAFVRTTDGYKPKVAIPPVPVGGS